MQHKRHRPTRFRPQSQKPAKISHRPTSRSPRETDSASPNLDIVMGRNCIEELLAHDPGRIQEIFLAESRGGAGEGRKNALRDAVEKARLRIRECSRHELDQMVQSDSHQGVVARVKPRMFLGLEQLLEQARERESIGILALDGVLDPQNVGAILRAAECFGVDAVLWSKNRVAPLGPVVSKVSVGASELVPLCPVSNLHRAIEALKEAGVWSIGAVVTPEATELESFTAPEKWVLVMGSEGEGIQNLIEQNLDFCVYIKMFGAISSLNVSQATAVMLHALAR
jgi:23S rRNA (guanosine2251-2'-O)-methyltransferase